MVVVVLGVCVCVCVCVCVVVGVGRGLVRKGGLVRRGDTDQCKVSPRGAGPGRGITPRPDACALCHRRAHRHTGEVVSSLTAPRRAVPGIPREPPAAAPACARAPEASADDHMPCSLGGDKRVAIAVATHPGACSRGSGGRREGCQQRGAARHTFGACPRPARRCQHNGGPEQRRRRQQRQQLGRAPCPPAPPPHQRRRAWRPAAASAARCS